MSASFSHPLGSATFSRAIPRPDRTMQITQPRRLTAAAYPWGFAHTITDNSIQLQLRMTTAEKDALIAFFYTIARGRSELFTYSDPSGIAWSARFASATLSGLIERAYNVWLITVALRIFPGAWLFSDGSTQLYSDGNEVTYA